MSAFYSNFRWLYFVVRRPIKVFTADADSVMAGYTQLKSRIVPSIAAIVMSQKLTDC
jgi:hypothetical protein